MSTSNNLIDNIINSPKDDSFLHSTTPMLIIDGASNDPIENAKAIETNKPIHLLACTSSPFNKFDDSQNSFSGNSIIDYNNLFLIQMGTIITRNDKATQAVMDSFIKNDKLANQANLLIYKDSILDLQNDKVPKNVILSGHSYLAIDQGAKIKNIFVNRNSKLHFGSESSVDNTSFNNVTTGNIVTNKSKFEFDDTKDNTINTNLSTTPKSGINILTNVNLGTHTELANAEIKNATLEYSKITKSFINAHALSDEDIINNVFLYSIMDNSSIDIDKTQSKIAHDIQISDSKIKNTAMHFNNSHSVLANSEVIDTTLMDSALDKQMANSESAYNVIEDSKLHHVVSNNSLDINNVTLEGTTEKPIITNKAIHLTKQTLDSTKFPMLTNDSYKTLTKLNSGGILKSTVGHNKEPLINLKYIEFGAKEMTNLVDQVVPQQQSYHKQSENEPEL